MAVGPVSVEVGSRIQRARLRRGLLQRELAKLVGVSQTTVSFWERGMRSVMIDDLWRTAAVLQVPVVDLLPVAEEVFEGRAVAD